MRAPLRINWIINQLPHLSLALFFCAAISSCGNYSPTKIASKSVKSVGNSVKSAGSSVSGSVKSASNSVSNSVKSVGDSVSGTVSKSVAKIRPSRIPIVAVRTEDLQEVRTGAELAQEWDRKQSRKRYAFLSNWTVPKNYKPAELPADLGVPFSDGLLPPLPGNSSDLPELPSE